LNLKAGDNWVSGFGAFSCEGSPHGSRASSADRNGMMSNKNSQANKYRVTSLNSTLHKLDFTFLRDNRFNDPLLLSSGRDNVGQDYLAPKYLDDRISSDVDENISTISNNNVASFTQAS
jgi:hypothetical protein